LTKVKGSVPARATVDAMTEPVAIWHADHVRFARLLDLVERELAAFHAGEQPDYALLLDVVHYLRHYPDRHHHPREDVAFARLVERDPALSLPVARRLQEHRVIAAAGDELLEMLQGVVEGALIERSALERAAATYVVYYRHHLETEEHYVMPRAGELLTAEDWAAVAAAAPAGTDPLFGDAAEARYGELRRRIAFEAARQGGK
jgi:hemerythrin-like domain-containing protein